MEAACHLNKDFFKPIEIDEDDRYKGIPIREVLWGKNMYRRLSYADKLASVGAPTLIITGRHDPETPVPAASELNQGIPDSRLIIFPESGHFPFIEEKKEFSHALDEFFRED